jgi:hypothetical protein
MILDTLNQARARWVDELREIAVTGNMPFKEYIIPNIETKCWKETSAMSCIERSFQELSVAEPQLLLNQPST